ncbi:hypothetical protein AMTRI_Chr04g246330 [Amborella trichopoda]
MRCCCCNYRERGVHSSVWAERASMADKERGAMPKPRGFNGYCIATIASISTTASCPLLLPNIEKGRSAKREREGGPQREREGGLRRERGRSVKRERIGERG